MNGLGLVLAAVSLLLGWSVGDEFGRALAQQRRVVQLQTELLHAEIGLCRVQDGFPHAQELVVRSAEQHLRELQTYGPLLSVQQQDARRRGRALVKQLEGGALRAELQAVNGNASMVHQRLVASRTWARAWARRHAQRERNRSAAARSQRLLADDLHDMQAMRAVVLAHKLARTGLNTAVGTLSERERELEGERKVVMRTRETPLPRALRDQLRALDREQIQLLGMRDGQKSPALLRPVEGRLLTAFGAGVERGVGVPVVRNGVELEAAPGERVRAIADGVVAAVSSLEGLANAVVVEHGMAQRSLLAGLERVDVTVGTRVEAGDVLGRARTHASVLAKGNTVRVYVEVRHAERPIDPAPHFTRGSLRSN